MACWKTGCIHALFMLLLQSLPQYLQKSSMTIFSLEKNKALKVTHKAGTQAVHMNQIFLELNIKDLSCQTATSQRRKGQPDAGMELGSYPEQQQTQLCGWELVSASKRCHYALDNFPPLSAPGIF